jgi:DNA replication protein DnaC
MKTSDQIISLAEKNKLTAFMEYKNFVKTTNSFDDNLLILLKEETDRRNLLKTMRNVKKACLPLEKTFDSFDMEANVLPHVDMDEIRALRSCSFIDEKKDVLLIGPPGRGKTHLAIATGFEAVRKGYSVLFKQTSQLLTELDEANSEKNLTQYYKTLAKVDLLILDEFGYTHYNENQATYLFNIISQRYEKRSIFYTTNYEYSKWENFIKNEAIRAALIDRIAHHSTVFNMSSPISYRLKNATSRKNKK